jgi:GNAT superfamily N-acetyltransferase
MESVRLARREDQDRVGELCQRAIEHLGRARGGPLYLRREAGLVAKAMLRPGGLDRLLADPRRRVVVGSVDDAVVGMAVGHLDAVGEATVGVVDGCYVEPEARGVGVGRALLDDLTGWFAQARCRGVDASALPGDREMKSLLEASGFKARLITMHRDTP